MARSVAGERQGHNPDKDMLVETSEQ
jgi:hypothetical protein